MGRVILNAVMVMATMWIVRRFWGSFFEKKKLSVRFAAAWTFFCIFQMYVQMNEGNGNVWMTICNVVLILLIAVSGYHCAGKQKYFLLVMLSAVWALTELLVFFILNIISDRPEGLDAAGAVISELLVIMFIYAVSSYRSRQKGELVPNNFYFYLLSFPVGSIYIAVNVFYTKAHTFSLVCTIIILLVFNMMIFELYIKMNAIFMYECDNAVYAQQVEIISGNTAEQKKIMQEFYREKHDLVNELVSLKGCIAERDVEGLSKNLDMIIQNYERTEKISDSGNSTVDALINFKYAVASEYGIKFRLKIFIPNELPIDICDIGVVLGNAIDNAIEAVKECRSSDKVIEISMGVKKESWIIVIKNPCEHEVKRDRTGMLMSTKQDKQRHGYGLKSIQKIADKYQGEAIAESRDGIFSLIIVLNFREF
ncbi:MAG: GHKL domain-containing protein [Lachnospiraceae bacterium]|nr:GHKL domain-containing protein [Lachnospiraceae bacterium]